MSHDRRPLPPGPLVIDGGLSTQLERLGCDVSGELWTARLLADDPATVTSAHRAFVDAGADIIITSSYQVSRQGFVESGREAADADNALLASIDVARAATRGTSALIAASVGPYGAILHDGSEYRGRYGQSHRQLVDFHRERMDVLMTGEPDLLAIETIPDVDEAVALVDVLADHPDIPAWMTFSASDDGHLWSGHSIEEAVAAVAGTVSGVGINCTDVRFIDGLLERMAVVTDLPLVVYPNAGGSWNAETGEWVGAVPPTWAQVKRWRELGAQYIGGCCGMDADAIRQLAASTR